MKFLDKVALALFSSIILILSVLFCLVIFGWINLEVIVIYIEHVLKDPVSSNVVLAILVVFILLAIKAIFFTSSTKKEEETGNGILIQSENGKLFISKETIQNLVSGVVKEVEGAKDVSAKVVLTKENNMNIDVVLYVSQNVVITELTKNLQLKIKEAVKKSLDIDIKDVNIQVKNIATPEELA